MDKFLSDKPLSDKEKMIQGLLHKSDGPELTALRLKTRKLLHAYNLSAPDEAETRKQTLRELFQQPLEGKILIEPPFYCDYGFNIKIGHTFYANFDCVILDCGPVNFGDEVLLGPKVQIYTVGHPLNPQERAAGWEFTKSVNIGNRVWIGGGAIILPGVSIGDNSIIGAGSVVSHDIPAGVVVAGNPARIIKNV